MSDIVDVMQRSSFQLSSPASTKLRRMTRSAGLSSENVISRVAIARSLRDPLPEELPTIPASGAGKEIRGLTLLGRKRPAALLLALIARHSGSSVDADTMRLLIRYHWERGVSILDKETSTTAVMEWVAQQTVGGASTQDSYSRDEIARILGRQYGRWPLEVRRMVANASRLSLNRASELARHLDAEAAETIPGASMSEAVALAIVRDRWQINRIGLDATDRRLLERLDSSEPSADLDPAERAALPYLADLGLISTDPLQLTEAARQAGSTLWTLR